MSLNSPNNTDRLPGGEPETGVTGYLLRLSQQADRLQAQLDRLAADVRHSDDQVAALTRHLTDPASVQVLGERLAELMAQAEASQARLDELMQQNEAVNTAVTRLARTQFKTNTLAEGRDQQIDAALATLQEIVTRRAAEGEARSTEVSARPAQLRSEARGELAVELLPALDGLELAIASGEAWLSGQREAARAAEAVALAPQRQERGKGTWQRLRHAFLGDAGTPAPAVEHEPLAPATAVEALDGWLRGLTLVRERFLRLLALEGIHAIDAQGRPFDPRLHVAVETATRDDMPPGTVVTVLRKGYRQRERVLRYAEVVVSREPASATAGAQASSGADFSTAKAMVPARRATEEEDQE